ncbi:class I SAM-dependent methyltransferase [Deinococcus pimensis]|uniref:class I SAM-dependent methyltransferase n=1 Tax=Deinococcus pimensis TaxID=309888 RepID=UPI00048223F8|nr:class I SAM-dependent methyltransferase [Deinococcus pimensis]
MTEARGPLAFYSELASWWPLISPVEEYAEEAAFAVGLLRSAGREVREVLELGSGGGHNAAHLKAHFDLTLVDLSEEMLEVSRSLNPSCAHVRGDMRSVRLGRTFDAVFVHDAVDYMTSEADLRRAMDTAFAHCRPLGVAVFVPDQTRETFEPGCGCGGNDGPDGRGVRFMDWSWDPDPSDGTFRTEYAFLLREADGSVRSVHETHELGLFGRAEWLRWLAEAGFEAERVTEVTTEDRTPRDVFVARRSRD